MPGFLEGVEQMTPMRTLARRRDRPPLAWQPQERHLCGAATRPIGSHPNTVDDRTADVFDTVQMHREDSDQMRRGSHGSRVVAERNEVQWGNARNACLGLGREILRVVFFCVIFLLQGDTASAPAATSGLFFAFFTFRVAA